MIKRIADFQIEFKFIYFAVLCTVLFLDKNGGIFFCFLASALHELGHLLSLIILKQKVKKICFSIFDIKIIAPYPFDFQKKLVVVLSGVITNFIFFIFFFRTIPLFGYANLFVGIFNILPVSTLDGGQALELILRRVLSEKTSNLILNILTVVTALPIFTIGIIILLNTGYNFSFLMLGIYLMLTVICKNEALEV